MYANAESRSAWNIFEASGCRFPASQVRLPLTLRVTPADGVAHFPETRVSFSHRRCKVESVLVSHDLTPHCSVTSGEVYACVAGKGHFSRTPNSNAAQTRC